MDAAPDPGEARKRLEQLRHELASLVRGERHGGSRHRLLTQWSHELRTPLNAIIGYSELLEEEASGKGHESLVPDLRRIHGAGRTLLDVIDGLVEALDAPPVPARRPRVRRRPGTIPR